MSTYFVSQDVLPNNVPQRLKDAGGIDAIHLALCAGAIPDGASLEGGVFPRDLPQALAWLQKAADQGHAHGGFSLGEIYRSGIGVPVDHKRAFVLFGKAADRGLAEAQYALGVPYIGGRGVAPSVVTLMQQLGKWGRMP